MSNIYEFIAREFGTMDSVNIIEIGAHIGTDTLLLSKFVGTGKMTTFEPDPRNIPILQKRIQENNLNVSLVGMAVSCASGKAQFNLSSGKPPYEDSHLSETTEHTASSSLKRPKNHLERFPWVKFDQSVTVDVTTLDEYFGSESSVIDIVWADVQGAELEMILGGKKTLARTRFLFTEFNNNEMYDGQPPLKKIKETLPGEWGEVFILGDEVLLQNKVYGAEWVCDSHAQQCWNERYGCPSQTQIMVEQEQVIAKDFIDNVQVHPGFFNVLANSKSMLEIGCGLGYTSRLIKERFPQIERIVATDISDKAIAHAKGLHAGIAFARHDATKTYNDKFDICIASNLLQLFKDPFALVDNMLSSAPFCIVIVPFMQPVTDGYNDEGGTGHVFKFTDAAFAKYDVKDKIYYVSRGWQHSAMGEPPLLMAVLMGKKGA